MSTKTKDEVVGKMRARYVRAGREYRRKMIDEAVALFGYHRKAAIRALGGKAEVKKPAAAVIGRPREYEARGAIWPAEDDLAGGAAAMRQAAGGGVAGLGAGVRTMA